MMLSLPSFLAAATRADMPPPSAADLVVFQSTFEPVPPPVPPPQAASMLRAPARMARRACFIDPSLLGGWYVPPFNHLADQMSRKDRLGITQPRSRSRRNAASEAA